MNSGGGKVPLPTSLWSWQVRHFSFVSTQFPFPSSFGFSTITRLLQPRTVLGRTSRRRMEKRGEPCIAKGPLATAGSVSPCNLMDSNHGSCFFLRKHLPLASEETINRPGYRFSRHMFISILCISCQSCPSTTAII